MKRIFVIVGGVATLLVLASAYFFLRAPGSDRLCEFVRQSGLSCVTLIADPHTFRPGGIAREVLDLKEKELVRLALPDAYLDSESCLLPGVPLMPLASKEGDKDKDKSFSLPRFTYDLGFGSRLGGSPSLPGVQDLVIDADASASRVSAIVLDFGPARTRLLDEYKLLDRVESCQIRPRCVERIKQSQGRIINRVLEVESLSYSFEDSQGVKIPLGILIDNKTVRVANASFDLSKRNGTTLDSRTKLVIGLSTIESSKLSSRPTCDKPVDYTFEGVSTVTLGGGGRPGHIQPQNPRSAPLGELAQLTARGTENSHGNMEQHISRAVAAGSVQQVDDRTLRLVSNVDLQAGHWGVRGVLGPISGHDTSANAQSSLDGRINVLVRVPRRFLHVQWTGFPDAPVSRVMRQSEIQIVGTDGKVLRTVNDVKGAGSVDVDIAGEGQYAVKVRSLVRAEGSGWDSKAALAMDAKVTAEALDSRGR